MPASDEENDLQIDGAEYILRALGNGDVNARRQIRWQALAPPIGEPAVSVMRLRLLGPDGAKARGLAIKGDRFVGFGRARAETYLGVAESISDSRDEFHGHADLAHGFRRPPKGESLIPGEPVDPSEEYLDALEHYLRMARVLCFFGDDTSSPCWCGANLEMHCANEGSAETCVH